MKTAIVTGAAGDIGTGISQVLAGAGYKVGMLDLEAARVREAWRKYRRGAAVADVTDERSVDAALDTFADTPDLCVNNAGVVRFGYLLDVPLEDFRRVLDIESVGVFVLDVHVRAA
jgi:NAD(P)-dependent dehydrogenase (short-subunit alcohol dehydrogenase family)